MDGIELKTKHYNLAKVLLETHLEGRTEDERQAILTEFAKVINDLLEEL